MAVDEPVVEARGGLCDGDHEGEVEEQLERRGGAMVLTRIAGPHRLAQLHRPMIAAGSLPPWPRTRSASKRREAEAAKLGMTEDELRQQRAADDAANLERKAQEAGVSVERYLDERRRARNKSRRARSQRCA